MTKAQRGSAIVLAGFLLAAALTVASIPLLECVCVRPPLEPGPSWIDCSICRNIREISPLKRLTVRKVEGGGYRASTR